MLFADRGAGGGFDPRCGTGQLSRHAGAPLGRRPAQASQRRSRYVGSFSNSPCDAIVRLTMTRIVEHVLASTRVSHVRTFSMSSHVG